MKKIILSFLATALFTTGIMAEENANCYLPVAVRETSGGFVSDEYHGWGKKISIYPNGDVIKSTRQNYQSPWKYDVVAVLSSHVVNEIVNLFASLEPGQIQFPDEPQCADIPASSYQGLNGQGNLVEFAQDADCRFGTLENFYEAYRLRQIFDGFDSLTIDQ